MICILGVGGSIPSIGSKVLKRILGEYQSGQMGQTVNLLVYTFGGSNPSSPTNFSSAEVAQSIEHQPSKLRVAGSNLVFRSKLRQCSSGVERFLGKEEVASSILATGSAQFFCI